MSLTVFLLFLFVGLPVLCGVVVWGLFDAGDRPLEVWAKAGRSRRFWLWGQALGIFVPPVVTLLYLAMVRPGLQRCTPAPAPADTGGGKETGDTAGGCGT